MIKRVVLTYAIFSAFWIFLSDRLLESFITNPLLLSEIQTFKGWLFVAASAALIAFLLQREQTGRKLIEDQLRQSRRSFQELFSRNPTPMWVYDVKTLSFLAVNDAAVALYGYSAGEFLKMNLKDIRPAEDIPGLEEEVSQHNRSSLKDAGTWQHRKKDGSIIYAHIISHAVEFGGREAVLVHSEDITQRYAIELAYQKSESKRIKAEDTLQLEEARLDALLKLNNLVERSVDEVIDYGLEECIRFSQSKQGFLAFGTTNRGVPQSTHALEFEINDELGTARPVAFTEEMASAIKSVIRDRQPILQNEVEAASGSNGNSHGEPEKQRSLSIPLMEGDRITLVAGVSGKQSDYNESDIRHLTLLMDAVSRVAQRKQVIEALSRSETRFRSAIESLPFDFWMMDADGRYTQQNGTCIANWGNWIGKRNEDISIPADLAAIWEENKRRAYQGEYSRMEVSLPSQDGEVRQVYAVVGPIQYKGENQGILGINIDITALKQREAELRMINRLSGRLRDATTRAEIQPIILDETMAYLQAESASILSVDEHSVEVTVNMGRGKWSSLTGQRFDASDYPLIRNTIRSGTAYIGNSIQPEGDLGLPFPLEGCNSIIALPLIANQKTIGLFILGKGQAVSESEGKLMDAVADLAANAMQRALISEQKDLHLNRLTALRSIDGAITASLDIQVTLNILLDQLTNQPNIDAGNVLLLSPLTQELNFAASRGFRSSAVTQVRLQPGVGLAGKVVEDQKILLIPDLDRISDPLITNFIRRGEGFTSYIGLPLIAKEVVKGVIEIYSRTPVSQDDSWLDFLQAVASQAAIAIDHSELFKQLQASNDELTLSYDATIEGWARALELRDRDTEGHTRRVTDLTLRLAHQMGGYEDQMVHLRRGVLLHDIGKMAIPDDILLKEGPLTDDEWEIMKRHPTYAYELLSPIPYLQPAIDIPYSHHEHWDGSGYPQGLAGEDIPMASRIFSVVDVWDALRNDRPYRRAWPEKRVLAYIQGQAGRLFDPNVIPTFLDQVQRNGFSSSGK